MSNKREKQKRRLKRLIREACEQRVHEEMPCPITTANKIKSAGATPDEFMNWVNELMDNYISAPGSQIVSAAVHDPLASVAVERYQQTSKKKPGSSKSTLRIGSTILGVGFGN